MTRTKVLDNQHMLANINGLSVGDRAHCGPYGIVECYKSASTNRSGKRLFKVIGSKLIHNGGNYTMGALRKAIIERV